MTYVVLSGFWKCFEGRVAYIQVAAIEALILEGDTLRGGDGLGDVLAALGDYGWRRSERDSASPAENSAIIVAH